jgi:SagB-type dehydrogenase family enzyme
VDTFRNETATLNASWIVYGAGAGVSPDDPAELYHEASAFYATQIARQIPGAAHLESNPQLQATAARSTKRHPHVRTVALPAGELPTAGLGDVLSRRRSRVPAGGAVSLEQLAVVLRGAYGVTSGTQLPNGDVQALRSTPSAGALYPSEVYALAFGVPELDGGLYHYDPLRHALEALRGGDLRAELLDALPMRAVAEECALALIVTSMFWRARFKYGQRGYRFALLEAGHLVQNLLLGATALDLASVPVGGFYDRKLAELLAIDGVNEAPLYVVPIGSAR